MSALSTRRVLSADARGNPDESSQGVDNETTTADWPWPALHNMDAIESTSNRVCWSSVRWSEVKKEANYDVRCDVPIPGGWGGLLLLPVFIPPLVPGLPLKFLWILSLSSLSWNAKKRMWAYTAAIIPHGPPYSCIKPNGLTSDTSLKMKPCIQACGNYGRTRGPKIIFCIFWSEAAERVTADVSEVESKEEEKERADIDGERAPYPG